MALPSTGSISMSQVNTELKKSATARTSLNDADVRKLADKPSGKIAMNDLRGKSKIPTTPQECDYYFETMQGFNTRKNQIIAENNNDLSQKTFGFGDGVTNLSGAFAGTSITSTPKMIFARNVNNFSYCFESCYELTTIPQGLFDNCPNVNDFSSCFRSCSIAIIPQDLFDNCHNVNDFSFCFYLCPKLTTVPFNLFDNCSNATDFSSCFYAGFNITSALPDVWNKSKFPKVTYGNLYASECTKAANYSQIPSNFK